MNVPPDCRKARCRQRPGSASVFQLLLLRRRGSVRACDRYSAVWTHHGRGLRVVAAGSPPRDKIGNNDACRRLARHESACRDHDGIFLLRRRNGGGLHVRWRRPGLSLPERAAVSISLHRRPGPYREPMPTGASTVSRQVSQDPLAARCCTAHGVTRYPAASYPAASYDGSAAGDGGCTHGSVTVTTRRSAARCCAAACLAGERNRSRGRFLLR